MSVVKKSLLRAGVAAAVACALAACASGPHKSDSQRAEDKAVSERVETALNADKDLYAKHITASADNGVVHLTGFVWESSDFEEAVSVAENVPGVTKVVNNLELSRNGDENGAVSR